MSKDSVSANVTGVDCQELSIDALLKNMSPDIRAIEAVIGPLAEADRLSLAVLQSEEASGGKTAQDSIDVALNALESATTRIKDELRQRRARIDRAIRSGHNAALPAVQLPPELFSLIIETLAYDWPPFPGSLGWIVSSHVCAVWRHRVLSIAHLWARIAGVFRVSGSFHTMLSRSRDAPLTLRNLWFEKSDQLSAKHWGLLQSPSTRHVKLVLPQADVDRIAAIMHHNSGFEIETLLLRAMVNCCDVALPAMSPISGLRSLSLSNLYIPFQAQNLVTLFIRQTRESNISTVAPVSSAQFLETLKQCEKLVVLQLHDWAPAFSSNTPHPTIKLPCLKMLVAIEDSLHTPPNTHISFFNLIRHLDLPQLALLIMHDVSRHASVAARSIVEWLLSGGRAPPCIQNASHLGVQSTSQSFYVGIDDGSPKDIRAEQYRIPRFFNQPQALLDCRNGVYLQFDRQRQAAEFDGFFQSLVTSLFDPTRSPTTLRARSVLLDSQRQEVDWALVLNALTDIKVLYVPFFPCMRKISLVYLPEDDGLLTALSNIQSDGTLLLPRLHALICSDIGLLVPRKDDSDDEFLPESTFFIDEDDLKREDWMRADLIARIRDMLAVRAAHGTPITCMKYGSAMHADKAGGREKEAEGILAQLVASYV